MVTWIGQGAPQVERSVASGLEPFIHPGDVERIATAVAEGDLVESRVRLKLRAGWREIPVQLDRMIGHGPTVVCLLIAAA